jgi:hypothetical protein
VLLSGSAHSHAAGLAASRAIDAIKHSTKALEERLCTLESRVGEKADKARGSRASEVESACYYDTKSSHTALHLCSSPATSSKCGN